MVGFYYFSFCNLQLFARRSKHVPDKYRRKWDALSVHYMSEEEDGPDDVVLVKTSVVF